MVDTLLPAARVVRKLKQIKSIRGVLARTTLDNEPEMSLKCLSIGAKTTALLWVIYSRKNPTKTHITSGSPAPTALRY